MDETTFGWALKQLWAGKCVSRLGWNGSGQYIALQKPNTGGKMTLPYLYIRTAQNHLVPWVASQTDLLADDWRPA